jgi:hypothetical protein
MSYQQMKHLRFSRLDATEESEEERRAMLEPFPLIRPIGPITRIPLSAYPIRSA